MNLGCMAMTAFVFFYREWAYIDNFRARPKGRAPSYPEPAAAGQEQKQRRS
jgi:hypothetical protein